MSRYACYLIVQKVDSGKRVVALKQTYFVVQATLQELTSEYFNSLDEDHKRLITRSEKIY